MFCLVKIEVGGMLGVVMSGFNGDCVINGWVLGGWFVGLLGGWVFHGWLVRYVVGR